MLDEIIKTIIERHTFHGRYVRVYETGEIYYVPNSSYRTQLGRIENGKVIIIYPNFVGNICCCSTIMSHLDFREELIRLQIRFSERLQKSVFSINGQEGNLRTEAKEYLISHAKKFTDLAKRTQNMKIEEYESKKI